MSVTSPWPTILQNHEILSRALPPTFRNSIRDVVCDNTGLTIMLESGERIYRRLPDKQAPCVADTHTLPYSSHGIQVALWLASTQPTLIDILLVPLCRGGAHCYALFPDLDAIAIYEDGESIGPPP